MDLSERGRSRLESISIPFFFPDTKLMKATECGCWQQFTWLTRAWVSQLKAVNKIVVLNGNKLVAVYDNSEALHLT